MEAFSTSCGFARLLSDCCSPLPSQAEMTAMDRLTIESGISSKILMERAGKAILIAIREDPRFEALKNETILILCGPGNNGGDGLVIASELFMAGREVLAVLAHSSKGYSEDYLIQLKNFLSQGGKAAMYTGNQEGELNLPAEGLLRVENGELRRFCRGIVVDALLGTGQKSSPRGAIGSLLNEIIEPTISHSPLKLAVDLPTGLNGDTGEVFGPCFKADLTICVEHIKRGLLQAPARLMCGEIKTAKIDLLGGSSEFSLFNPTVSPVTPDRSVDSHKGLFGKVLIIGGSRNMPGAPVIAAQGALTCGAGIVIKAHLNCFNSVQVPPEVILSYPLEDTSNVWQKRHLRHLEEASCEADVVVLGPGLGQEPETSSLVKKLLENYSASEKKAVIDADALNIIAADPVIFSLNWKNMVLTPHPGEMARLLGKSVKEVQRDRYSAVRELSKKTGGTVLLKGASSLVYGRVEGSNEPAGFVNSSGNPYMASPGMGDFLCGVIATLMAQGCPPTSAAALGAFLHGRAGDQAHAREGGPVSALSLSRYFWS